MATNRPLGAYGHSITGLVYDALNAVIWLPRGSRHLRKEFVATLGLAPGASVLELGCGTGQVTESLVASGASVTAVDRAEGMLDRARRRAPDAEFELADVLTFSTDARYDAVVLALILHELPADLRRDLLDAARRALCDGGRVAVLEWSRPAARVPGALWRTFVRVLEPPPALEVLDGALETEFVAAGWELAERRVLAGGRATVYILTAI